MAKIVIGFIKKFIVKASLLYKKYSKPEKKVQAEKAERAAIKPQVVAADEINK